MKITIALFLLLSAACSHGPKCKALKVGQVISLSSGDVSVAQIASDGLSAMLSDGSTMACIADKSWAAIDK